MTSQFDWSQFQEESPKSSTKQFDWDKFEEEKQGSSRARSLISAPIKGLVKGAADLASFRDPAAALLGLNQVTPHQTQAIESILPTQEHALEKGLERAGKLTISALGGPEAMMAKLARIGGGAALGQLAEEMGAPEIVQNLAELSAFITSKPKFLPKKSQQEAVDFLRQRGFSDKQITPLIQSEKKLRRLLPIAEKGQKTQQLARDIGEKLGENYEILKETGRKSMPLRGSAAVAFDDKLENVLDKINPRFKRLIEPDLKDLRNKGISSDTLINFYQDINAVVKDHEGGKAVLKILKKPIMEGLKEINPEVAQEFTKLNDFYARKARLSEGLNRDIIDQLLAKGKSYATAASIASGNFGFLKGMMAKAGFQRIATELLTNPKLQNISDQMLRSIKNNDIPALMKGFEIFKMAIKNSEDLED